VMYYEAVEFSRLIEQQHVSHSGLDRARIVSAIITQARDIIGVRFPADEQALV